MDKSKRLSALLLALLLLTAAASPAQARSKKKKTATPAPQVTAVPATPAPSEEPGITVEKDGEYTDKEHVAAYLRAYHRLPSNYITKKDAQNLGWSGRGSDSLWKVAPGKSIGGSRFGNYEGLRPDEEGRRWFECDIDYDGKNRGVKRIVYSSDGLIYYTEDHYNTFEDITEPETRAGP